MLGGGLGRFWTCFALLALVTAGPLRIARESEDYQNDFSAYTNYTANEVCFSEGEVFQKGDVMPNPGPCEECRCEPPSIVCNMVKCPVNSNGCRTIQRANHCCPDYNCECDYNGQLYSDGERLEVPEEPCQVCYCKGGEVMCNSITCYRRDDCDPIHVAGQCCPKYENCPVRDMGSSSSDDKSILIRSTNKTGHVAPKREMNPWLLTKVPAVSSATQDSTTEGGDVVIVSDWLSERKSTTGHSFASTDKPDPFTYVDHLTTDIKQDLNSDAAVLVKKSDTITPVDEVIFTRIDSQNPNGIGNLKDTTSKEDLQITSAKVTPYADVSDSSLNVAVSNDDYLGNLNSISGNTPETETVSEIEKIEGVGSQKYTDAPIKIQEVMTFNPTVSTEFPTDLNTVSSNDTKLKHETSDRTLNTEEERKQPSTNPFQLTMFNSKINQGFQLTDLQGPFFTEEMEFTTQSNEYSESSTLIESKEELKEDIHKTTPSPLDLSTNSPQNVELTTLLRNDVEIKEMHADNHRTNTPKRKKDGAENRKNFETGSTDYYSTTMDISRATTEKNAIFNESTTVANKLKGNNSTLSAVHHDSTSTDKGLLPIVESTLQTTTHSDVVTHVEHIAGSYTSGKLKVSPTTTEPLSLSTVYQSDEFEIGKEDTTDEPPVLELNSHVPFLQFGGHVNTDQAIDTFGADYKTTTINERDNDITTVKPTKQDNTTAIPTIMKNKSDYISSQGKQNYSDKTGASTDHMLTSSHIPLTPGDLKVIAEYLINDTIKPAVARNITEENSNGWLRGNLTSEKTVSSIMSAANVSIAVLNQTNQEANKVDKTHFQVVEPARSQKNDKDKMLMGNNVLNQLKTANKTGFVQGKSGDDLNSKNNSIPDVPGKLLKNKAEEHLTAGDIKDDSKKDPPIHTSHDGTEMTSEDFSTSMPHDSTPRTAPSDRSYPPRDDVSREGQPLKLKLPETVNDKRTQLHA